MLGLSGHEEKLAAPPVNYFTWFRAGTFESILRLRGVECNAPDGYAEAFHVRKLVM